MLTDIQKQQHRRLVILDKEALDIDTAIIEARRDQRNIRERLRLLRKAGKNIFDLSDPLIFRLRKALSRLAKHIDELGRDLADNWSAKRELTGWYERRMFEMKDAERRARNPQPPPRNPQARVALLLFRERPASKREVIRKRFEEIKRNTLRKRS
ncbi:MAG: hypothetical protein NMNS01_23390 [Nitrosomonas sp.]|nr:MAG: hypothetical protein NMNS01_23390 [Nitrosomonas sp.]